MVKVEITFTLAGQADLAFDKDALWQVRLATHHCILSLRRSPAAVVQSVQAAGRAHVLRSLFAYRAAQAQVTEEQLEVRDARGDTAGCHSTTQSPLPGVQDGVCKFAVEPIAHKAHRPYWERGSPATWRNILSLLLEFLPGRHDGPAALQDYVAAQSTQYLLQAVRQQLLHIGCACLQGPEVLTCAGGRADR